MDNGAIFGLQASFDKAESVSKLFPSPSQKLNSSGNGSNPQEILTDFADKIGKMNKVNLLSAASGDTKGAFLDVFA